jgi:hypothetical protein
MVTVCADDPEEAALSPSVIPAQPGRQQESRSTMAENKAVYLFILIPYLPDQESTVACPVPSQYKMKIRYSEPEIALIVKVYASQKTHKLNFYML